MDKLSPWLKFASSGVDLDSHLARRAREAREAAISLDVADVIVPR
jgi:hypothetical protein